MGYYFRNQYEMILVIDKGKGKYYKRDFSDVQETSLILHSEETHPHQKPLDLILKILEHSSKSNDIVLDPFLGSGTTAVACKMLNRHFIGIEINPEYCKIAEQRLNQIPKSIRTYL